MAFDRPAGPRSDPGKGVAAVLGPTNTGKTHLAIERMLAYSSGVIGLPLRLLAREVYDRVVAAKGASAAALITGEEKIVPPSARYFICTVEAMPREREADFVAIDEIQLAADPERGHIFTSRLLNARGRFETMLLGAASMRRLIGRLLPSAQFVSRPRFSKLSYAGPKKISRLPRRSVIVAFSADAVYSIAELVRRQRGGAAVVLGALSPRTRNAQVALYQSGEVDFLVATDAIGMGLNMDVDHVAFAAARKFDGRRRRPLTRAEIGQIAGRAGRHMNDGTFGVTGDCPSFDADDVEAVEEHEFEDVQAAQWRNEDLSFASAEALLRSLDAPSPAFGLQRTTRASDADALRQLLRTPDVAEVASGGEPLRLLWDVCQIPDFRNVASDMHARLLGDIYGQLTGPGGRIDDDWLDAQVSRLDRTAGDVDALASRIAHVRTWTFVANRAAWVENATYWQGRTRAIEDSLSDALHERLTQRFVDRRTSVLIRRLRDDAPLLAGVTGDGEVVVEGQFVGRLNGFQFIPDPRAKGVHGKALRAAALRALKPEIAARAARLANAGHEDLTLAPDGSIRWRESVVGRLARGPSPVRPAVALIDEDLLSVHLRPTIRDRLAVFAERQVRQTLEALIKLDRAVAGEGADAIDGLARGVGFRLVENYGALSRKEVAGDVRALDQVERAKLRKFGVRFGEYAIYMPALLKPAPARLRVLLWAISEGKDPAAYAPPGAGLTSIPCDPQMPAAYYYAAGFRPCGLRAVRLDMLDRLGELIRKAKDADGAAENGFEATADMMSLMGCSGADFEGVLSSLGYRKQVSAPPEKNANAAGESETAEPGADEAAAGEAAPVVRWRTAPNRPRKRREGGKPRPKAKGEGAPRPPSKPPQKETRARQKPKRRDRPIDTRIAG
ncbi:MAG: helicase-related protein [Pseudomonadota bacterium]